MSSLHSVASRLLSSIVVDNESDSLSLENAVTTLDAPFRFIQEENVSILILQPELNKVQWGEIDSIGTHVLNALASQPHPNVIVDLSELNYMGSAMVALIVRVWKATLAKKGKLSVVCPHAGVKEVLKLASLDKHWAITETQDEARKAVGAGRSSLRSGTSSGEASPLPKVGGAIAVVVIGLVVMLYLINPALLGLSVGPKPIIEDTEQTETPAETPAIPPQSEEDTNATAAGLDLPEESTPTTPTDEPEAARPVPPETSTPETPQPETAPPVTEPAPNTAAETPAPAPTAEAESTPAEKEQQ